jgi:hypothetical protein
VLSAGIEMKEVLPPGLGLKVTSEEVLWFDKCFAIDLETFFNVKHFIKSNLSHLFESLEDRDESNGHTDRQKRPPVMT